MMNIFSFIMSKLKRPSVSQLQKAPEVKPVNEVSMLPYMFKRISEVYQERQEKDAADLAAFMAKWGDRIADALGWHPTS